MREIELGGRMRRIAAPSLAYLATLWEGDHPERVEALFEGIGAEERERLRLKAGEVAAGREVGAESDPTAEARLGGMVALNRGWMRLLKLSLAEGDPTLGEAMLDALVEVTAYETAEGLLAAFEGLLDEALDGIVEAAAGIEGAEEMFRRFAAFHGVGQVVCGQGLGRG